MNSRNENLIKSLIKGGYLKTPRIIEAFRKIDRKDFVAPGYEEMPYFDEALPIGYGQTISQPRTVAFMLELLAPEPGEKILDVGSGSGWTATLLVAIVGERGKVIGVERIPELVEFGKRNLAKYAFRRVEIKDAGKELGFMSEAPFDRILVSAAGTEISEELVRQLKIGGRMVAPVMHSIWKVERISGGEIKTEEYFGFSFVPLVRDSKQN